MFAAILDCGGENKSIQNDDDIIISVYYDGTTTDGKTLDGREKEDGKNGDRRSGKRVETMCVCARTTGCSVRRRSDMRRRWGQRTVSRTERIGQWEW